MSTANMNLRPSKKYGIAPEEVERRVLSNERFKTIFNMKRIKKIQGLHHRLDDNDKKKYSLKKKQLRENLSIGEKVYALAERIKKKSAPGKFYKQSVQNISYFNKEKRLTRTELFALRNNFS